MSIFWTDDTSGTAVRRTLIFAGLIPLAARDKSPYIATRISLFLQKVLVARVVDEIPATHRSISEDHRFGRPAGGLSRCRCAVGAVGGPDRLGTAQVARR